MAQKICKTKKRKLAPKKAVGSCVPHDRKDEFVIVGNYKTGQLAWIEKNGVYNYPVREGDDFDDEALRAVKELWLYADVKSTQHAFAVKGYLGKMTRSAFIEKYPTYAKLPSPKPPAKSSSSKNKISVLPKSENRAYYVFEVTKLDYKPTVNTEIIIARTADFGGRSAKVKKAIAQFKADGEYAPLAAYLPKDLSKVPKDQLRVCEPLLQMEFVPSCVPFPAPQRATFKFIDLFAGIGGFRMAMQQNGGECVFSSEWNPAAQKTYFANYGDMPYGDITLEETKRMIPNGFDVLCAGFPCQPFSIAGVSKKNSLGRATGFEDKTQGTLFFDVCTIIKRKRPRAFLLENVKNLCSHDKGNTFRVIRESLEELDYSIFFQVIDGQNFVPQHRERILIVGFDRKRYGRDMTFDFKIHPVRPKPVIRDILERNPDPKYTLSDKLWGYLQQYAEKHKAAGNGFGFGIAPQDGVSRTLSARYYKDGSEILIEQAGRNPRRLTPLECARLMGYPSSFKIVVSDCQAYRQFGNSVVMPLMADVGRLIIKKLSELEQRKEAHCA